MGKLLKPNMGTLKAKSATSNDMFSVTGITFDITVHNWDTDLIVNDLNCLLAIAGKTAVDDSNLRFNADYKKVS